MHDVSDDCKYDFTRTWLQNRPTSPSSGAFSSRFTTETNSNPQENSLRSPSDPVSRENQATLIIKDPNFYDENDDYDDNEDDDDDLEYSDSSFKATKLSASSDDVTLPSSSSSYVIDDVDSRQLWGTGVRPPTAKTNWSSWGQSRVVGTGPGTVYISSHESKDDRDFDRPLGNNFPYKITQKNNVTADRTSEATGLEKTRNNNGTEQRNGRKRDGSASGGCPELFRRLPGKILLFVVVGELTAILMLEW